MSFRRAIALAIAVGLAPGCAFDSSGSGLEERFRDGAPPSADADDSDATGGVPDAAAGPDATACVDSDDDGYTTAAIPGAVCDPADCDDGDENVYPGQTGAFTTPKNAGDYDYNCDGVEEKLSDTRRGGECREEIFGPCEGTGWLDAVPACGQLGTWHRCEDTFFGCEEAERIDAVMPCR